MSIVSKKYVKQYFVLKKFYFKFNPSQTQHFKNFFKIKLGLSNYNIKCKCLYSILNYVEKFTYLLIQYS